MSEELRIFLAEDNPADAFLIKQALSSANLQFNLCRVEDGEAALRALEKVEQEKAPPSVILLDLNLPKISGHELLARVRNSEQLRATPVIVLTSSDSPDDRARTAALKISHYFRKPSDFKEFLRLGKIVERVCRNAAPKRHDEGLAGA